MNKHPRKSQEPFIYDRTDLRRIQKRAEQLEFSAQVAAGCAIVMTVIMVGAIGWTLLGAI